MAREIKALGDGLTVSKTRVGEEEAEINLRYGREDSGVFSVKSHQVLTPFGQRVPIGTVAEITESKTPLEIRREKLRRTVTVTAEVDNQTTTSREVNANLSRYLDGLLENYPGYSFRFRRGGGAVHSGYKRHKKGVAFGFTSHLSHSREHTAFQLSAPYNNECTAFLRYGSDHSDSAARRTHDAFPP